jgi:drug/metabolite transporter (DMT)-like permease
MPAARGAAPGARAALAAAAVSAALFLGMDAAIKLLSARYDTLQLTFLRFAAGSLFALPLWAWFRAPLPRRASWPLHGLRTALLLAALLTWFYSLSVLPLVQAVAVGFTAPIFISLLAIVVLRERPSGWIGVALALGAAGVAVSLGPELGREAAAGSEERVRGLLAAALSALCYSGSVIVSRQQAQRDPLWTILLVQNLLPGTLLGLALCAPSAAPWPAMTHAELALLVFVGLLVTGGLYTITWALQRLEASRLAPVEYTGLVWAAVLGWLVFGEVPTPTSLTSAALIIGGCLLLLRR